MTPPSPAARRYFRSAAGGYGVYCLLTSAFAVQAARPGGASATIWPVAALFPTLAVVAVARATIRYLAEEVSALQRAIQIEALSWEVGVTFGVATAWGFLGRFVGAPQPASYWAFAVFGSVVGSVQLARRLFPRR